jgi:glucuronide carrier protein
MRPAKYLGYAAGEIGNNLTFSMVSAFLLIYYTDVAKISAAAAGTLFLVVRLLGGGSDLVAGYRVDGTSTRWGRFRPYLLFGSAPLLILLVALFSIPGSLRGGGALAWAAVSYALFQVAYSFVNIPYGSLAAAITQEPELRARLSTARVIASSITILLIAVVVSPQIAGSDNLQRSLTLTTTAFAIIGYALYIWCFASVREMFRPVDQKTGLREMARMLSHNRPLVVLCGSTTLFLTGMFALQTVGVYYARDVLGNADLYIAMTVVQTIGMIVAAMIVPWSVGALGKKRTYVIAGLIGGIAGIGVALAPSSTPALGVALIGVIGMALGAINTLIFALQAETVDYGEWQTGVRAEGASYGVVSFTRKAGQGVGGAVAAYTIGLGGYVASVTTQSQAAVNSIRIAAGGIPAVMILAAAVVLLAYPLTEERVRRMVGEVAQRRAGREAPIAATT